MKDRHIALLGILLAIIDVGIPYLFLKDVTSYWANYVFWTGLTLTVLAVGLWKVRQWGD